MIRSKPTKQMMRNVRMGNMVVAGLGLCLLMMTTPVFAQTQLSCQEARAQAEDQYLEGAFDEVIALLESCIESGTLAPAEAVPVHRLLILASLKKQDPEAARLDAARLLTLLPDYMPDPIQDPPAYATLIAEVKESLVAVPSVPEEPEVVEESVAVITEAVAEMPPPPVSETSVLIKEPTPPVSQETTFPEPVVHESLQQGMPIKLAVGMGGMAAVLAAAALIMGIQ